jgi:hypothetical protein
MSVRSQPIAGGRTEWLPRSGSRLEDGTPADPPTLKAAVPNWRAGDTIALGANRMLRRMLRVVDVRDDDARRLGSNSRPARALPCRLPAPGTRISDQAPVLVVEETWPKEPVADEAAACALISLHGASHLDGRAAAVHDRRTPQRAFLRREAPTRPPGFPEPPPPPNPSESAA